ncbi:MAG TPA: DsbC family protein [Dissulfurispiraceae bacterium]|nr:DsbC family protein [Dissulfurispiraceae bacterium]
MKQTGMTGIYEVRKGHDIIYFLPEYGHLFFGEIITREGKNLTEQRKDELVAETAKKLPVDKAVTFGNGKHVVIEFTDPDCPYCRKASEFLKSRADITRHVFFLPLPMHPDAGNKAKYVLCAEDRAKAYEEAMSGKLDDRKYQICARPEVPDILNAHVEAARNVGVSGTPFFIINGKAFVRGADIRALETALGR